MGNEFGCDGCGVLNECNDPQIKEHSKDKVTFSNQKGLKIGKSNKNNEPEKFNELLFESKFKQEDQKMKDFESNFYDYEPGLRISLAPDNDNCFEQSNIKKSMFIDEIINTNNQKLENGIMYTGEMMRIQNKDSTTSDKILINNKKVYLVNGRGKIFNTDGSSYEGFFDNGYANGFGKLQYINGDYYEGEWLNDFPDGLGFQKKGKIEYKGNFIKGLKEGQGEISLPDKSKYNGEFKNDNYNGFGKMSWVNGMEYSGLWENSKMNGEGQFTWPDKNIYKGQYLEGLKHGIGEFIYSNGLTYKGNWKYGIQNGIGYLYKNEKLLMKGNWINGKFKEEK